MENTRTQPKKSKINFKPKPKSNANEVESPETQTLSSPIERLKANHLATTPITPAGNIVDMQGSLDQTTPDKIDNEKSDNNSVKSEHSKESASAKINEKEQKLTKNSDELKNESENVVSPDSTKEFKSPTEENKFVEQTDSQVNKTNSSEISKFAENQGKFSFYNFKFI